MNEPIPTGLVAVWASHDTTVSLEKVLEHMRPDAELMSVATLMNVASSSTSFSESLLRRIAQEDWSIRKVQQHIDASLSGEVVYAIEARGHQFHFIAYSNADTDAPRVGRLRENEFDLMATLYEGPFDADRLVWEGEEMRTKVWKGRTTPDALAWTFANRSTRVFRPSLEEGRDLNDLFTHGGYAVRNAGCYGNGRHGTRSWASLPPEHPLKYPYHMDLLCLLLWRHVGFDLLDELARLRPGSRPLSAETRQLIGVGNSSGIGTVATLVRWPSVLSAIVFAREFTIAHALASKDSLTTQDLDTLTQRLSTSAHNDPSDVNDTAGEDERADGHTPLDSLLAEARQAIDGDSSEAVSAWSLLERAMTRVGGADVERLRSALTFVDPIGSAIATELIPLMIDLDRSTTPELTVQQERAYVADKLAWALDIDLSSKEASKHFWYKSEENGENRRGERYMDEGAERETFVDFVGGLQGYARRLVTAPAHWTLGRFLLENPEETMMAARVNLTRIIPYSIIRNNIISADFRPSDIIRAFLSFLGLTHLSTQSQGWVSGICFVGSSLSRECGVTNE